MEKDYGNFRAKNGYVTARLASIAYDDAPTAKRHLTELGVDFQFDRALLFSNPRTDSQRFSF